MKKGTVAKGYIIIALIAFTPMICSMLASLLGVLFNCPVNEAGGVDCIRFGINWGETLSSMFIMFWAMFISLPLSIILLLFWRYYTKKRTVKQ